METKKNSFVLIMIIVALTLVLVVLSIFLMFSTGSSQALLDYKNKDNLMESKETDRPSQDKLATRRLFEENVVYNITSSNNKTPVIQVNIVLEYYKKIKGIRNVEAKIVSFESSIREVVGTYFQKMTIEEIKDPNTKIKAKKDLTVLINKLLNSDEKNNYEIIYDIIFEGWFYQ